MAPAPNAPRFLAFNVVGSYELRYVVSTIAPDSRIVDQCHATANMYDFSFLAPCPSSGLVIQGDEDDIVPAESVNKLVQKLSKQRDINIDYRLVEGANHFFHDKLDELTGEIDDYLAGPSKPKRAKAAAR